MIRTGRPHPSDQDVGALISARQRYPIGAPSIGSVWTKLHHRLSDTATGDRVLSNQRIRRLRDRSGYDWSVNSASASQHQRADAQYNKGAKEF